MLREVPIFGPGKVEPPRAVIVGSLSAASRLLGGLASPPHPVPSVVGLVTPEEPRQAELDAGPPVLGRPDQLATLCRLHRIEEVLIAWPEATGRALRELLRAASAEGAVCRIVAEAGASHAGSSPGSVVLRPLTFDDLLRRPPHAAPPTDLEAMVGGRTVLITGAGGSIGRELCRQLAAGKPERVLLLGHGENSIFGLEQQLDDQFPRLAHAAIIADVRDAEQLGRLLQRHRPAVVFHTAAHKHVPLMERNVAEAIRNNVLGTRSVLRAAASAGVSRIVVISTDKAVRPTSVMGATKRIAEQLTQLAAQQTGENASAVRFGNVVGSRGSVIPTFLRQIAEGRPITLTDPGMQRYFLPTPEAVELLLAAAAMARGGEVFALDMGEPLRVADLAADLVRLSGRNIPIRVIGARPGEKLHEEPFFDPPLAVPTTHPRVRRSCQVDLPVRCDALVDDLIGAAVSDAADPDLRRLLQRLVPDYADPAAASPASGTH